MSQLHDLLDHRKLKGYEIKGQDLLYEDEEGLCQLTASIQLVSGSWPGLFPGSRKQHPEPKS